MKNGRVRQACQQPSAVVVTSRGPTLPVTVAERGPQYTTLIEQYLTNDHNSASYSSATNCLSLSSLPVAVCGGRSFKEANLKETSPSNLCDLFGVCTNLSRSLEHTEKRRAGCWVLIIPAEVDLEMRQLGKCDECRQRKVKVSTPTCWSKQAPN